MLASTGAITVICIIAFGLWIAGGFLGGWFDPIFEDWLIERVKDLHKGQEYDGKPYIFHLENVLRNVETYWDFYGDDPDLRKALKMAALFHDTLEDSVGYTYHDLEKDVKTIFPDDEFYTKFVCEIVYACTAEKGRNRAEREGKKYYDEIKETGYAPFIKACDRLANIEYSEKHGSRMLDVYKKEMPEFISGIENPDNPIPPSLKEKLCHYLQD